MNRTRNKLLALVAIASFSAIADDGEVFDSRFYIAPVGSYAIAPKSRYSEGGLGGGLSLGKAIAPHFTAELLGDYLHYQGQQVLTPGQGALCSLLSICPGEKTTEVPGTRILAGGLGGNLFLSPANYGAFLHADFEAGNHLVYNGGLGFDVPFEPHAIGLRVEALYHKESYFSGEPYFRLGLRIPLGSMPVATPVAQPEPPPKVVPVEAPPPQPAAALPPPPCSSPAPDHPIDISGCKTGDVLVLHGVNFDFNKASLTLNAKVLLDQVGNALLARKDIKVEVDGHTDGKGSAPYNMKLSQQRADSVKQYLAEHGVDAGRMTTKGFGKTMPIADNNTEDGRELNRRVELKVTESDAGATPAATTVDAPAPADSGAAAASEPGSTVSAPTDGSTPVPPNSPGAASPGDLNDTIGNPSSDGGKAH